MIKKNRIGILSCYQINVVIDPDFATFDDRLTMGGWKTKILICFEWSNLTMQTATHAVIIKTAAVLLNISK